MERAVVITMRAATMDRSAVYRVTGSRDNGSSASSLTHSTAQQPATIEALTSVKLPQLPEETKRKCHTKGTDKGPLVESLKSVW